MAHIPDGPVAMAACSARTVAAADVRDPGADESSAPATALVGRAADGAVLRQAAGSCGDRQSAKVGTGTENIDVAGTTMEGAEEGSTGVSTMFVG